MAYALKSTGIAANCTMCVAVDPDDGVVKDFASSGVTADMVIGANVTYGSQDWDGNTRDFFRLGAGTAADDFVAFGTTKPAWSNNVATTPRTWVFIGEAAGGQIRVFGKDSSNYVASQSLAGGGATYPAHFGLGYASSANGGNTAISSGNKVIFGFSTVHTVSGVAYNALHNAANMDVDSVAAPDSTSVSNNFSLSYVGRRNDNTTHQQDKIHAVLIFNIALSEAQWDSLRDDWRTVLLEQAAAGDDYTFDTGALAVGLTLSGSLAHNPFVEPADEHTFLGSGDDLFVGLTLSGSLTHNAFSSAVNHTISGALSIGVGLSGVVESPPRIVQTTGMSSANKHRLMARKRRLQ